MTMNDAHPETPVDTGSPDDTHSQTIHSRPVVSLFQLRWVTLVHAITLLTFGAIAHAEIYKWVDGDGKVQFSDEPPVDRLPSVVHEMDLSDRGFNTNSVGYGNSIPYQGAEPSRLLQLDLPIRSIIPKNFVGTLGAGASCREIKKIEIDREGIVAGRAQDDLVVDFYRRLEELGYNVSEVTEETSRSLIQPTHSGGNRILLESTVRDIEINLCGEASRWVGEVFFRTTVNLAVDWKGIDPRTRSVIFSSTSTGYHRDGEMHPLEIGTHRAMVRAFADATNELFSKPEFVELLNPESEEARKLLIEATNQYEKAKLEPIPLTYKSRYLDYFDRFDLEEVKPAIVTVRTPMGHGSGFLLAEAGYVLTNWHVVEGSEEIEIVLEGGDSVSASIAKANIDRDIALLQFKNKRGFDPLPLARAMPAVGESIFVVGTPIDDALGRLAIPTTK